MNPKKGQPQKTTSNKKRKEKNKTQPKPPMQRVLVLRNNKRVLEWHPW